MFVLEMTIDHRLRIQIKLVLISYDREFVLISPGLRYRSNNWDTTDQNGNTAHTGKQSPSTEAGFNEINRTFPPLQSRIMEFDSTLFLPFVFTDVGAGNPAPTDKLLGRKNFVIVAT